MNGLTPALTLTLSPRRGNSHRTALENLDVSMSVLASSEFASNANRTNNATRLPLTQRMFLPLPGGEGRGEGERLAKHFSTFIIQRSSFCIFV